MTTTQTQHQKIIQEAIRIYMSNVTDEHLYPSYYKERIDRIKKVPIDFESVCAFGLERGKQVQLCKFAIDNDIASTNPVFVEHLEYLQNL